MFISVATLAALGLAIEAYITFSEHKEIWHKQNVFNTFTSTWEYGPESDWLDTVYADPGPGVSDPRARHFAQQLCRSVDFS